MKVDYKVVNYHPDKGRYVVEGAEPRYPEGPGFKP